MATIKEDYVSFEIAKLLKEKGFDGTVHRYYHIWDGPNYPLIPDSIVVSSEAPHLYIIAPTLQMAMKWLREVHKISIEITSTGYLIDNDVDWECDIMAGRRLYFKHITNEKSFESCAEAAIKYCLENLI